jgi:hypothetical protein
MTLQNTRVAVVDFSSLTSAFGERLAGLLGYPFFAKAVIEVNYPQQSISCFDPQHYRLPRGEWQPLTLKTNRWEKPNQDTETVIDTWRRFSQVRNQYFLPTVTARFEGDVEGLFLVDTGSTSTVHFLADFVQKHHLLDDRDTSKAKRLGVSGEAEIFRGKIAWFELAGHRFEEPTVGFRLPNTSESWLPEELAGIIGQGLMREFIVVFNYPESKIAFWRK